MHFKTNHCTAFEVSLKEQYVGFSGVVADYNSTAHPTVAMKCMETEKSI